MGLFKYIPTSIKNYFNNNTPTPETNPQQNDFTGLSYNGEWDEHGFWEVIRGSGLYDRVGTQNKYKSYAYAAINKIAINLAKAQCFIYREYKSKTTEVKDHPLLKVFRGENIYGESFPITLFLTAIFLKIKGEAFWHIVITKTPIGKVVTEIRLLFGTTECVFNKENTLVDHYRNGSINFSKDEIIHLKHPNPYNRHTGYAPVDAFNFTLDVDFLQGRTIKAMLNNNMNLEGILKFPGKVTDTNREKIESTLATKFTKGNNGKTMIVDNGTDYVTTQTTPKEMDYKESRLQIRDEILVILDVPKTVMNISDDVNYNNSKSALRSFLENTLQPFCKVVIEAPLNTFFRKIYGDRFLLSMEYEFESDRELQLATLKMYLQERLIKKTIIAEMEGFSASDVPEDQPILEPKEKEDEEPVAA